MKTAPYRAHGHDDSVPRQAPRPPNCCGCETTFVESVGIDEIRARPRERKDAILQHLIFECHLTGVAAVRLLESLGSESGTRASLFRCAGCDRLHVHIDSI